jgi:hypothetical protein
VNTDNVPVFKVSSDGYSLTHKVMATSFGALGTGSWYNIVAWHSTGSHIGISVNLSTTTAPYTNLIPASSAPFLAGGILSNTAQFMDGRMDLTGVWNKTLSVQDKTDLYNGGDGNALQPPFNSFPWASFDF